MAFATARLIALRSALLIIFVAFDLLPSMVQCGAALIGQCCGRFSAVCSAKRKPLIEYAPAARPKVLSFANMAPPSPLPTGIQVTRFLPTCIPLVFLERQ